MAQTFSVAYDCGRQFKIAIEPIGAPSQQPDMSILFSNGFSEAPNIWTELKTVVAARAEKLGLAVCVASYRDDHNRPHSLEDRRDRLLAASHVLAETADVPMVVVSHSRGWLSAIKMVDHDLAPGHVRGVIGVAPVGHTPFAEKPEDITRKQIMSLLTEELRLNRKAIVASSGVRRATLGILFNGVAAGLRGLNVPFGEGQIILSHNFTDKVETLSDRPDLELAVHAGGKDPLAPGLEVVTSLAESAFAGSLMYYREEWHSSLLYHSGPVENIATDALRIGAGAETLTGWK